MMSLQSVPDDQDLPPPSAHHHHSPQQQQQQRSLSSPPGAAGSVDLDLRGVVRFRVMFHRLSSEYGGRSFRLQCFLPPISTRSPEENFPLQQIQTRAFSVVKYRLEIDIQPPSKFYKDEGLFVCLCVPTQRCGRKKKKKRRRRRRGKQKKHCSRIEEKREVRRGKQEGKKKGRR